MAFIRTIDSIKRKWANVTPGRTADYEAGIRSPRKSWAQQTKNAEGAYEAGVTSAIAQKRFGKGVTNAGDETWQSGAMQKGLTRWGPGVQLAEDKYGANFGPYRDVIERTTLPPRYARRDPRNLARVAAIANALGKAKEARLGGKG